MSLEGRVHCLHQSIKRCSSFFCRYITKQGARCHGNAVYSSDYCGAHVADAVAAAAAANASSIIDTTRATERPNYLADLLDSVQ